MTEIKLKHIQLSNYDLVDNDFFYKKEIKVERLKRLKLLAEILKSPEKTQRIKKFNMGSWKCKTSGCALGSAACYKPFNEVGLDIFQECYSPSDYFQVSHKINNHDVCENYEAGKSFFFITIKESDWVFNPENYYIPSKNEEEGLYTVEVEKITRESVLDRVNFLIKHYQKNSYPLFGEWTNQDEISYGDIVGSFFLVMGHNKYKTRKKVVKKMKVTEKQKKEMLKNIEVFDGLLIHQDEWPVAEALKKDGLVELSSARGPGSAFKRVTLIDGGE